MEKTILKKLNELEYHYTLLEEEVKMNYDTRNVLKLIHETRSLVEKLTLTDVSQQRELLIAYEKHTMGLDFEKSLDDIDEFLANNCG